MDVSKESALLGEVKSFHSFNGTIQVPRGWMQCNGNVINETNYDAIHGTGAYDSDGIADLVLDGKYTPNMTAKYIVGASSTTQTGSSAITSVGNSSNQINIQHNHTVDEHNHVWLLPGTAGASASSSMNSAGVASAFTEIVKTGSNYHVGTDSASSVSISSSSCYTNKVDPDTDNSLSTTQSIQPESIELMYIIRVGI